VHYLVKATINIIKFDSRNILR